MTTVSLYRLHTDALDEQTLKNIADRILKTNPNQKVYIYEVYEKTHEPDCECGQCTGEDKAIEQMEKGIAKAERDYGDD